MKATATKNLQFSKVVKIFLIAFVVYYLAGLVLGFIGLQLRCQRPMYSCWSTGQYISDPWLFLNTLFWPFTLSDGLDKANIIF